MVLCVQGAHVGVVLCVQGAHVGVVLCVQGTHVGVVLCVQGAHVGVVLCVQGTHVGVVLCVQGALTFPLYILEQICYYQLYAWYVESGKLPAETTEFANSEDRVWKCGMCVCVYVCVCVCVFGSLWPVL